MLLKTKFGLCIYTSPSGYKVYQNFFYRWLTLESNALQTIIYRYRPQRPVLHYLPVITLMARQFPGNTCLLGLGGASVAQMLSAACPKSPIVAVDCSEEIIHIAKQFFMTDSLSGLTIVQENAIDHLRACQKVYQHILIDLYDAKEFPRECQREEFFIYSKNSLKEGGFIAVNLANYHEQWPILQLIKKQFNNTLIIPIKKSANIIVLASAQESNQAFIHQMQSCPEIRQMCWMEGWGNVGSYKF